mmetsp:Transcript_8898/g.11102  ORF Transcript_8898/g.11102 Transcript_8898/m.11102 type:complete len:93 (-) Transcript_8898:35-313(-)
MARAVYNRTFIDYTEAPVETQPLRAASEPPPFRSSMIEEDPLHRQMFRRYVAALDHRAEQVAAPENDVDELDESSTTASVSDTEELELQSDG